MNNHGHLSRSQFYLYTRSRFLRFSDNRICLPFRDIMLFLVVKLIKMNLQLRLKQNFSVNTMHGVCGPCSGKL